MTTYREASNNAKAARLGITDQRPVGTRSKRERPFVIEFCKRLPPGSSRPAKAATWRKWGAYRTEAEALRTMEQQARKYSCYEFRLRPQPSAPLREQPTTP